MGANPLWGEDWEQVRRLWPLDDAVLHCNHGSFGAVPKAVLEAQDEFRSRMVARPALWFSRELPGLVVEAHAAVAAFLNADAGDMAFVTNVSAGVSVVAHSLHLEPGLEVVSSDHIYGAVSYALDRLCARTGAARVVVKVPFGASDSEVVDIFASGCSGRTGLVVIDQVTSATARRFPVEEVTAVAHRAGAAVLVDGAHAPGMLAVDVPALGADFWTGNLHKWVCAPPGTGVLWVAPEWQSQVKSPVVSWNEPYGFPSSLERVGTNDLSSWLAAPVAIRLLGALGWERARSHNEALVGAGQRTVAEILGTGEQGLRHDPGLSMALVPLPPDSGIGSQEDAEALQARLAGMGVETVVTPWLGGALRLSAHVYNQPADYERLGVAVRNALAA